MINIKELAPKIYESNKAKGFWPQDRNFGEAIMLVTDELSEAHEAWRRNKRSNLIKYEFIDFAYIKDTFEDELADAAIRLLDIAQGYGMDLDDINETLDSVSDFSFADNMGQKLLQIQGIVMEIYINRLKENGKDSYSLAISLAAIISMCQQMNIDLDKHIELKLKYNSTRDFKHGKEY